MYGVSSELLLLPRSANQGANPLERGLIVH